MNQQTAKEIATKIETDFRQLECNVVESGFNKGSYIVGVYPHTYRGSTVAEAGCTIITSETEYDTMMEAIKLFTSPLRADKREVK